MLHQNVIEKLGAAEATREDDAGAHVLPCQLQVRVTLLNEVGELEDEEGRSEVKSCDEKANNDLTSHHVRKSTQNCQEQSILASLGRITSVVLLESGQITLHLILLA